MQLGSALHARVSFGRRHNLLMRAVQVKVLWVVNQQQAAWEAALPADTQEVLRATRQQKDAGSLRGVVQDAGQAAAGALGVGVYAVRPAHARMSAHDASAPLPALPLLYPPNLPCCCRRNC